MFWLEHEYGENLKVLNEPVTQYWLAQLCLEETQQPRLNHLIEELYRILLYQVLVDLFPRKPLTFKTRMAKIHGDKAALTISALDPSKKIIVVNLARAGTWPSHVCYSILNELFPPRLIRQDHIFAARQSNTLNRVTGTQLDAAKIGGNKENAMIIFPDPMGATGHTLVTAAKFYEENIEGKCAGMVAMHLIVTPEYLARTHRELPNLKIYALRVDRGLSKPEILREKPGRFWSEEKGLDDNDYIVPGAGGLGELLNNSDL